MIFFLNIFPIHNYILTISKVSSSAICFLYSIFFSIANLFHFHLLTLKYLLTSFAVDGELALDLRNPSSQNKSTVIYMYCCMVLLQIFQFSSGLEIVVVVVVW